MAAARKRCRPDRRRPGHGYVHPHHPALACAATGRSRALCALQVHPHATEKDIAGLFAKHGSVLRVSKSVTPSEQGPHAVGQIVMATETEAQVCGRAYMSGCVRS